MQEAMGSDGAAVATHRDNVRRARKRTNERCSVCQSLTWYNTIPLMEPEGVPEPRQSWILCQDCYQLLVHEMRRSPIRSPLRLRIAMGIIATERWPRSRTDSRAWKQDRKLILFIAWSFFIALILHLVLIVMIAAIR